MQPRRGLPLVAKHATHTHRDLYNSSSRVPPSERASERPFPLPKLTTTPIPMLFMLLSSTVLHPGASCPPSPVTLPWVPCLPPPKPPNTTLPCTLPLRSPSSCSSSHARVPASHTSYSSRAVHKSSACSRLGPFICPCGLQPHTAYRSKTPALCPNAQRARHQAGAVRPLFSSRPGPAPLQAFLAVRILFPLSSSPYVTTHCCNCSASKRGCERGRGRRDAVLTASRPAWARLEEQRVLL